MKNTRFHWIGDIPTDWELIKLGYLCSLKGRIGWKGLRSDEFLENSYAYLVTGQDFISNTVDWGACYQIEKARYDEDPYIQLKEGDLLVTKDGTIGKIAKVSNLDKPACLNSGIFVLRQTANRFDQSYLYWQLYSSLLTDYNTFVNSGASTIQHLYQNVFERMPLIVPPLAEQKAIAEFLDEKCGEIDKLLADLDAEVKTLTEYKKSIIAETVTRGLNPNASKKSSGIEWIGEIPSNWQVLRLEYCVEEVNVKNNPIQTDFVLSLTVKDGVLPYDEKGDVGNKAKENHADYKLAYPNTIVLNSMNILIGAVGISKYFGCVSPVYYVLKNKENCDLRYINYILSSITFQKNLRNFAKGILEIRLRVSAFDILKQKIPFPSLEEQIGIANFLDKKCLEISDAISDKIKQLEKLKAYKSSLIYEYVTGKKQVI